MNSKIRQKMDSNNNIDRKMDSKINRKMHSKIDRKKDRQ